MLQDLNSNTTRILIQGRDIVKDDGSRLEYASYQVSSDLRYILFTSDIQHAWRHSTRANYWIHDLEHSTTVSLLPKEDHPTVEVAKWAPHGHNIAYVRHNDLYITILSSSNESNNTSIRITSDGNETTFNGIPDWVYEEEVFSSDSAMWWSPDGKKLAFLSFDESEVQVYSYPIYNPDSHPGASAYPSSVEMRYPKPGSKLIIYPIRTYISSH